MAGFIRRPLPWDSQPQEAVDPNDGAVSNAGLVGLWNIHGLNPASLLSRPEFSPSSGGTMAATVGPSGRGIRGTAASAYQYLTDQHLNIGSADYWLAINFVLYGYDGSFGSSYNVLGGYGIGIAAAAGAGFHVTSANQLIGSMNGLGSFATSETLVRGKVYTALLYSVGSTGYFYLNGRLVGSVTKASPNETSQTRLFVGSDNLASTGARTWNGIVSGCAIGVGALSAGFARDVSGDFPGTLFAPSQIIIPVSAGGGSFNPAWARNRSSVIGAGVR